MPTGQTADRAELNRTDWRQRGAAGEQNCVNVHLVATKGGAADVLGKWRRCHSSPWHIYKIWFLRSTKMRQNWWRQCGQTEREEGRECRVLWQIMILLQQTGTNKNNNNNSWLKQLTTVCCNLPYFFGNISSEKFDWWGMLNRVLKFEFDWLKFRDDYFISKENFC